MTIYGCDYSFSRPSAGGLKVAGKQFAVRYISPLHKQPDGTYRASGKDLSRTEWVQLRAAGIYVPIVWEAEAGAAKGGFARGVMDAKGALTRLAQLGLVIHRPVYFAIDYQVLSGADLAQVLDYIRGVASVMGKDRTGVYAQYSVVKACFDAGIIGWGWQTYAWSQDQHHVVQWDPRAQLRQYLNGQKVAGGVVDLCTATVVDYGQWPAPFVTPVVKPAPKPAPHVAPSNVVRIKTLAVGVRAEDVRTYQLHLRPFATRLGLHITQIAPSGATGYYGKETAALTRAVYNTLAVHGGAMWLRGDLTIPGKALLEKLGLTVKE